MAKVSIEESTLFAIGDAIREKNGTTTGLDPKGEMPAAIRGIRTEAEITYEENSAGGLTAKIG